MQVVYSRCCGLDVHKKSVTACVLVFDQQGRRSGRKKQYETHRPGTTTTPTSHWARSVFALEANRRSQARTNSLTASQSHSCRTPKSTRSETPRRGHTTALGSPKHRAAAYP